MVGEGQLTPPLARGGSGGSATPTVSLAPFTVYKVTLSSSITDLGGNALAGAPIAWSFTTGADTIAPQITSRFPDVDDTGIPITSAV